MNDYPLSVIEKFITLRWDGEHNWDAFASRLESAGDTGIWLPGVGDAYLVESCHRDWDSDDDSFFVFRIENYSGARFFRVSADSSSFGGVGHGRLEEVKGKPTTAYIWEAI